MIDIDYHLEDEGLSSTTLSIVKDNLEVVSYTTYKLQSKCSDYAYTDDELSYSKNHINQLITDIVVANLNKIKHQDNRIYEGLILGNKDEGPFYYVVNESNIYKVYIDHISPNLYRECDKDYEYTLTEYVYYINVENNKGTTFINDIVMLNHNHSASKDKFFDLEQKAINYLQEIKTNDTN